jgi:hypothetical protein
MVAPVCVGVGVGGWIGGAIGIVIGIAIWESRRGGNVDENKQYRDAVRDAERANGCRLNDRGRDRMYDAVDEFNRNSDTPADYHDMRDIANDICRDPRNTRVFYEK